MSLLLPEKLSAGLFPGHCWLKRGRAVSEHALNFGEGDIAGGVVTALSAMLDAQSPALRKGSKVSLMVSDSLAALAALPWHRQLTAPEEINGYATACFEGQGIAMNSGWVMHAEFRTPGSMGLAYALPAPLVTKLVAVLATRGLTLDRLLPVSALTYWRLPRLRAEGQQLVVLREQNRIGAMVFDQFGLQSIDAEPVAGTVEGACGRLLRRIAAYNPLVGSVIDWSASREGGEEIPTALAESFPAAAIVAVGRRQWS